jgi:hypothetical protein
VKLPPGLLAAGQSYSAIIWARSMQGCDFDVAPFRGAVTQNLATAITSVYSPSP